MITPASFRADVPAFSDDTVYDDAAVNYWLAFAGLMFNASVWGVSPPAVTNPPTALIDFGMEFFIAHNLILEKQAEDAGRTGGAPVGPAGPLASRAIGPVSKSYDTSVGIDASDGIYNLTTYGRRLIRLAKQLGTRPIQISPRGGYGAAWAGPLTGILPFNR